MNETEFNQHDAVSIGWVTLVGVSDTGDEPLDRGNCFSVCLHDNRSINIVNFNYENLKKLQKLGLEWPIKISLLNDKIGLIADQRIHPRWYRPDYCETCCPSNLLPQPQRLRHYLDIASGIRSESIYKGQNGEIDLNIVSVAYSTNDNRIGAPKQNPPGYFWANYIPSMSDIIRATTQGKKNPFPKKNQP